MPAAKPFLRFAPLILALAAVAVYANSLPAPFIFDDQAAIIDNAGIRDLRDLATVLSPPANGAGVTARPLVNLTLAIDHALYGLDVRGYRATNIAIHLLASLTLWGLLRRIFALRPPLPDSRVPADLLAFAVALLWTVHPLQTETVTCIIQRTESLVSLCYLLTLLALVRGATAEPGRGRGWNIVMVLACAVGMAAKEVMVTAPVMAFFLDRTFLAGTFAAAWRRRGRWYLGLAATWGLLAFLVLSSGANRGMSAGFGLGITPWEYLLTQCRAIALYLRLVFWPYPLIADYGTPVVRSPTEVIVPGLLILTLLVLTLVGLKRWPRTAFAGVAFFGILAPSSSVVPLLTQTIAEHRMYLPLAAVLALATTALVRAFQARGLAGCAAAVIAAGALTIERNIDYLDEERLWRQNLRHLPHSARAHNNVGRVLALAGRTPEAISAYEEAVRLDPEFAHAHYNLALALEEAGRRDEAAEHYAAAVRLLPHFTLADIQLGKIHLNRSQPAEALARFEHALVHQPQFVEGHFHAGLALTALGRRREAIDAYARALDLDPEFAAAGLNLGEVLCQLGEYNAAVEYLSDLVARHPDRAEIHFNLGIALTQVGRIADARARYAEAVRLKPDHPAARLNHGIALAQAGELSGAREELQRAVALIPDSPEAHANLGNVLWESGSLTNAVAHFERALALRPDYVTAHYNLAQVLLALGRTAEAKHHLEATVRLAPDLTPARSLLEQLR